MVRGFVYFSKVEVLVENIVRVTAEAGERHGPLSLRSTHSLVCTRRTLRPSCLIPRSITL